MARMSKDYRNPHDIERELDERRMHISSTLDALENRLTPGQLVDTSLSYLREGPAGEYVRNLRSTVGENPVPVTLVGLGLAWLAMSGRQTHGYAERSHVRDAASSIGEAAAAGRESASEYMARTRQRVGDTAARAKASWSSTRSRLSGAGSNAYDRARGMGRSTSEMIYEHPLLSGFAAAALGALVGAMLPPTRTEDEYVGEARDTAAGRLKEGAERAGERARHAAEAAAEASGEQAAKPPHSAEEALSAAEAVARAAAEGASEEGKRDEPRPS